MNVLGVNQMLPTLPKIHKPNKAIPFLRILP
jgi:hypothetical protein